MSAHKTDFFSYGSVLWSDSSTKTKSEVVNQIWLTSNFANIWHQRYKLSYSILNLTSTNYYEVKHFENIDPVFQKQG